jgi:hypothetical protein
MRVLFTSDATVEENKKAKIYCRGADNIQCVPTECLEDLIEACLAISNNR